MLCNLPTLCDHDQTTEYEPENDRKAEVGTIVFQHLFEMRECEGSSTKVNQNQTFIIPAVSPQSV